MAGLFKDTKLCGLVMGLVLVGFAGPSWAQSDIYKEGQAWVIETGPYQGTEVLIALVEDHALQKEVIHITIPGPLVNAEGKITSEISHLPFAEIGLLKSALDLSKEEGAAISDSWKEGYALWDAEASQGRAGIFTITVTEAIDILFPQLPEPETLTQDETIAPVGTEGIELLPIDETPDIIADADADVPATSPLPVSEAKTPQLIPDDEVLVSVNRPVKIIDPNDDEFGDVQHAGFSDDFLARIKATTDLFEEVDGITFEKAVETYESELDPASSLAVFEEMARVYGEYCETRCLDLATKKEVYQVVLFAGMLPADDVVELMKVDAITKDDIREIVSQYKLEPDVIEKIEDLE